MQQHSREGQEGKSCLLSCLSAVSRIRYCLPGLSFILERGVSFFLWSASASNLSSCLSSGRAEIIFLCFESSRTFSGEVPYAFTLVTAQGLFRLRAPSAHARYLTFRNRGAPTPHVTGGACGDRTS